MCVCVRACVCVCVRDVHTNSQREIETSLFFHLLPFNLVCYHTTAISHSQYIYNQLTQLILHSQSNDTQAPVEFQKCDPATCNQPLGTGTMGDIVKDDVRFQGRDCCELFHANMAPEKE